MHNGIMCIRTAASRFLLRLGFCELALAAESLASLTIQALGVGLLEKLSEIWTGAFSDNANSSRVEQPLHGRPQASC